jgi:outer membrane protein OmpA-like peptidoglycan-associated protein
MKSRYLLSAGAALAVALGCAEANAQFAFLGGPYPVSYYIGPEGGWTSLANQNDKSVRFAGTSFPGPTNRYDSGFNVGARAGIQYGPIRVEEEYSYRHNGVSAFNLTSFGVNNLNGGLSEGQRNTHSLMTNFIYDFSVGWPVTPHIGVGIGAVDIVDSVSLNPVTAGPFAGALPTGPFFLPRGTYGGPLLHGSNWTFGYQAIAGFRYDINPLLALDVDYRYLATTNTTIKSSGTFPLPPVAFKGGSYTTGYNTQNLVASLTMKFGAPPPAPPPPPPPAPPPTHQVYLVFFDWDKYNITPEGMQVIQLAANQYKSGGSVRLQVTGYTDLSGSPGYNQRLSERRANAVAGALERLGVPRSDMTVAGRGMSDPRVPTPVGVREPQNRRVEIVFP